jgi:hypothetical protein
MSRARQHLIASKIWIGLSLLLAVAAAGTASRAQEPPLDPVVSQVVEMLNAGVSDSLIMQWMELTDRRPVDIGSQGVIALTEAGASEQLMTRLLELVNEQRQVGPSVAPLPTSESAAVGSAVSSPPNVTSRDTSDVEVGSVVRLSAKRVWVDEDEPDSPREERWSIYLYLDGELVAWARPDAKGEPVEARRVIQTGRRELRVVLQRYEELRRGWSYESLSVPTLIAFEVQPGDPIEIEVEMKRIWGLWRERKDGGPLSYVVRQGSEVLAENEGTGGNPDRWQPVCEDVEANFPDAESVPRAFRSSMKGCLRWADLWTGAGESTSRVELLQKLAEYDFQPPVR